MLKIGFVKIDRKITQWRWYHDANTFRVFFHLIVTANYEDKDFETITIKRGERVISYPKLAAELGLTERNIRTAIKHLKETGEVTVKPHSKFSVITINNYNQYQSPDSQLTDNRQADDRQVTGDRQASDNNERKINKDKESKKDKNNMSGKPDGESVSEPAKKKKSFDKQQAENDFEECWKIYPKKQGKAKALKSYMKFAEKDPDLKEKVISGIKNYIEEIRREKKNYRFIKNGDTYFNNECWNDEYDVKVSDNDYEPVFRSRNPNDEPF